MRSYKPPPEDNVRKEIREILNKITDSDTLQESHEWGITSRSSKFEVSCYQARAAFFGTRTLLAS
jgi:hypothetical protein